MSAPNASETDHSERRAQLVRVNAAITMSDARVSRSLRRAQWLSEIALALEEAHRLTLRLGAWQAGSAEAILVRAQLQAIMTEVEALRRGLPAESRMIEPKRTRQLNLSARPIARGDPPA